MSRTILLIEDEASIRAGLERMLHLEGYEVRSAEDGRGGLLDAIIHKPDLIITDLHMPFIDGFTLLRELSQNPELAPVPVIVLSAREDRETIRRALDAGAADYITKPFRRDVLLASINAQLKPAEHPSA